jgi:DNA invertase Pin-like site-specific DNA recombinase
MPRIRKNRTTERRSEQSWNIGFYIRLSREDENEDESDSVINQGKILNDFVGGYFEAGSYTIVDTYADDGRTGTDIHRPQFQRLTEDIINRRINCVIVKSLARGFRNLGDQSKFLEEFIPTHGARFICIGTPFIDTHSNPRSATGLEVPIHGLFNEQFAASTSEEVRKTFKMKRERGEFIGAFAPYGYKKSPDNKNYLVVDDEPAQIVRHIFGWFVNEGVSKRGIAQKLNGEGIPNPSEYKKRNSMKYQNPNSCINDGLWSSSTVSRILQNAMYIGTMVQGRFRVISYKVHKQVQTAENDWFVVENTHEAIIDRATFDKAQILHQRDTRTANEAKEVSLFSGFVRCADCQKAMHRKTARNIVYYFCRSFVDKKTCTKHSIRQDVLENAVLVSIQKQIELAGSLELEIERINNAPIVHRKSARLTYALADTKKQLAKHTNAADSLYMDWKSGDITQQEYHRLKSKFTEQIAEHEKTIARLMDEMQIMSDGIDTENPYFTAFQKHRNIQSLNRGMLVELVDTIWIHENGEVVIDFNFADQYQRILDYIENNRNNIVLVENKHAV